MNVGGVAHCYIQGVTGKAEKKAVATLQHALKQQTTFLNTTTLSYYKVLCKQEIYDED